MIPLSASEALRRGMLADAAALRPARGQGIKDPRWRATEIGESFTVDATETKFVSRNAAYYRKYYGLRFRCSKTRDGVVVTRVAL